MIGLFCMYLQGLAEMFTRSLRRVIPLWILQLWTRLGPNSGAIAAIMCSLGYDGMMTLGGFVARAARLCMHNTVLERNKLYIILCTINNNNGYNT